MKLSPYTIITFTMIAIFVASAFISGLLTPRENPPPPHPLVPAAEALEKLTGEMPHIEFTDEQGRKFVARWEEKL